MNANRRESEAAVLTIEAIEVHLSYLRPAVEALDKKIDETNERIDKTNEKLDQTNDRLSKVQGSIEGLKWFIASIAVILSGVSIAHTFEWI